MLHLGPDADHPGGRVAVSWSRDLLEWSAVKTVISHPTMWSKSCNDHVRFAYASLIDPNSMRRNFDSVGNSGYLYMTRFNISNCTMGPDRDLVRLKVMITP